MPFNIKVGGAWKEGTSAKVKVGGAWKTVESIQVKVGGAWKVAFTNSISPVITATVSPNPSTFSQDVTIQGFVLPVPTGGTVLVRDSNGSPVGTSDTVDTSTGAYSIIIPDQGIGTYTFSVNYSGFSLYQPASTNVTVNVGTIPTTTTITRSASTYRYNQTRVTLSGVVSPTPLSGGTVTISNLAQGTFGVADVSVVDGSYSLLVPIKDAGSYINITASYSGSGNYAPSVSSGGSGTTSYSVTQDLPVLSTVSPSGSSVQAGSTITFSSFFAAPALSGRTVIFEGLNSSSVWVNLGSGVSNASGQASFVWTAVAGYTQIRARYLGETNYAPTTSLGTTTVTVTTNIATTTSIARSAASYTYNGTRVTISGTVSPAPSGGTVTISGSIDGAAATNFATSVAVNTSTGAYSALMPIQNAGSYTSVTATYSGSGVYLSSTSGTTSYDITKASTSITAPAGFTNNFGTAVTSSTRLTTGGVGFSGQTVVFQSSINGGANWSTIASKTTDANGDASVDWTPGNSNTDRVRAVHNGSTNFSSSTSGAGTISLRTLKTGSVSSVTLSPNNFRFFGCNVNEAEAVSTSFSMPSAPAGAVDLSLTGLTVRVSGTDGESGSVRLCVWENTNAQGTYTGALIAASGFIRPRNRSRGQANIEDQFAALSGSLRFGGSYLAGFWREDNNCSYTTQFAYNSTSGPEVYYDNSMGSPEGFNRSVTFDSSATLIFTVDYSYYS